MKSVRSSSRGFSQKELLVGLGLVLILIAFSIPAVVGSRVRGNERSVISTLRTLHRAQRSYRRKHREFGGIRDLIDARLIGADTERRTRVEAGYEVFVRRLKENDEDSARDSWAAIAWPINWGSSGERMFLLTANGVLYETSSQRVRSREDAIEYTQGSYFQSFRQEDLPPEWTPVE